MAELVWDPRLITPARVLELAGKHRLYATYEIAQLSQFETEGGAVPAQENRWQINLRCKDDDQSVGMLSAGYVAYDTSIEDLLSGVLRHLVTAHDVSLSGAQPKTEGGTDGRQR